MALTEHQKYHLKKFVKELEVKQARHTEFVSVYVPQEYDLNKVINQLSQEQGTATNIKSAQTRNNVIDALERMIKHLRLYKQTPPNGMAVFSGNVAEREGSSDVQVWSIEPPIPVRTRIYRCDKNFQLDILREMLEAKEAFGLIVLDARDAIIAVLKGKTIVPMMKTHSHVPGKMKAGGQCLEENTLLMLEDGDILPIKDSHNPLKIISADIKTERINSSSITNKWTNDKTVLQITTKYPRFQINASKDHTFFVRTDVGVEEKTAAQLKGGEYLVMPEKIDVLSKDQPLNFDPKMIREGSMKKIKIPKHINPSLARLLGYYLGDGSYEVDRITFFEQRKDVAEFYQELIKKIFGIESKLTFRAAKNYYQLRCYSRIVAQLFKKIFSEQDKTLNERIPSIILKSSNKSLAQFIGGFFDAEGYISSNRISAGINNQMIVKQLQIALLRLGIIASIHEYDNRRNPYSTKTRYTLAIGDSESIQKFSSHISFSSNEKNNKLEQACKKVQKRDVIRQIFVNGSHVNNLLKKYNQRIRDYRLSGFLNDKRQLNKALFKQKLIDTCKIPALKKELLRFYHSSFIPVKINKITTLGVKKTVDIETTHHNFLANGVIVHNSAHRFQQNRELAVKAHYKKVADYVKEQFLTYDGLKGILVGGPGPTKYEFVDGNYLTGDIKKKIIGIKDLSYTEETGLQELLDKSQDILAQEEIAEEKKIVNRFLELLATKPAKVAYGIVEVKKMIDLGAVDVLLLSEALDDKTIEELETAAKTFSTDIRIISTETREGVQLRDLGKAGAILRYEVRTE